MRCWSLPFVCSKQQSVIQQLQARKGRLIVMCSKGDANLMCPNGGCRVIEVPQLQDCLQPIINIVPFQVYFDLSCYYILENPSTQYLYCHSFRLLEVIIFKMYRKA
jgi:glucosamine 6-phosphate synthetase-like amidotransferase/phosphosugar isomerase protein